ncbi:MAG: hypothetical protein QOG00_3045 [Pyrinomonadaceae bacterium]|nr:hypothetical protein [Pyrinomonadaceae bacterium]
MPTKAAKPQINASTKPAPKDSVALSAAAAATPVWVSQQFFGAAVTQVKQSTSSPGNLYWLNFSNSKVINSIDFIVTFKPGSTLTTHHQRFSFPGGYGGSTSTPFAVPPWGGNPIIGPAVLTVLANGLPIGSYNFSVIP